MIPQFRSLRRDGEQNGTSIPAADFYQNSTSGGHLPTIPLYTNARRKKLSRHPPPTTDCPPMNPATAIKQMPSPSRPPPTPQRVARQPQSRRTRPGHHRARRGGVVRDPKQSLGQWYIVVVHTRIGWSLFFRYILLVLCHQSAAARNVKQRNECEISTKRHRN